VARALVIHPNRLRPNPWNTNLVSPENEAKLAKSLDELGQFKPIIVRFLPDLRTDTDYEILGGEHRWQIAMNTGLHEVHIFDLGVVDDIKAKKISLADNPRYGADDTLALAKLLGELGTADELQAILPYTDADISAIFSATDIALEELDLPDDFDSTAAPEIKAPERATKTHTIMRFKVPLTDAEKITEKISKTQKRQGFSSSDELTNAGDALVHLLFADPDEGDE
jgi:ParB-like chromosome segregation protein Spo0J